MEREEQVALIASYLRGEITEAALLEKVRMPSSVLEELRVRRYLADTVNEEEYLEFQRKLLEYRKGRKDSGKGEGVREPAALYRRVAAAATIIVLVGFAGWASFRIHSDDIIHRETETAAMVSLGHYRGTGLFSDSLISMLAREDKVAAMEYVVELTDTATMEGQYLMGVVLFSMERWEESAKAFGLVRSHDDNLFIEDATYMLLLAQFRLHKYKQAITGLRLMAGGQGPRADDARRLLTDLRPGQGISPR